MAIRHHSCTRIQWTGVAVEQRVERVGPDSLHEHKRLALPTVVAEEFRKLCSQVGTVIVVAAALPLRLQHVRVRVRESVAHNRIALNGEIIVYALILLQ